MTTPGRDPGGAGSRLLGRLQAREPGGARDEPAERRERCATRHSSLVHAARVAAGA